MSRRRFLEISSAAAVGAVSVTLGMTERPAFGATISAQRQGSARSVGSVFLGLNGNNLQERLKWDRTDLDAALTSFGPTTLRYPAGTVGNYWDWHSGWFQANGPWPGQTDSLTGAVIVKFDNSLTPYHTALSRTGAKALFMLNLVTTGGRLATASDNSAMISDQVAFLKAAATAGIAVKRVELGNEFYLSGAMPGPNGNDYVTRFPTALSYAQQANAWVGPLRAAFPGLQIAAVGSDATGNQSQRRETWNDGVLSTLAGFTALTLHPYIAVTDGSTTPQSLLAMPYARVQSLRANELAAIASHGMKAWVTEFNLVDRTPSLTFAGTWTHGLAVAAYAILLAQVPAITLIDLHNVVGDCVAGAHFDSIDGFRSATPVTQFLARTAMGTTYATVVAAARGATQAQALGFPGGPLLTGGAPGLVGIEFTGGAQHQTVVINLASSAAIIDLSALYTGTVSWSRLSTPALTTKVVGPSSVTTTTGTSTGTLNFPAHTVTTVLQ